MMKIDKEVPQNSSLKKSSSSREAQGGSFRIDQDERYSFLVNNIPDYAIILLSPEGIVTTWNTGAEILKGYRSDEIVGQSFKKFYLPEDINRHHPENELTIAFSTGRYEEEGWRVRKDGTCFWANIILTRILDKKTGELLGFSKITRDLTERKKTEAALKESEERFRLIVESVRDYAIIMLDPNGVIVSWNEGAHRLTGYESKDILGQHFSRFYEPEEIEVGKCEYELYEANSTGRFEDEGYRIRKDGTKYWANVVITALRDTTGQLRGFAKVTRDMTDRKRSEDRLKLAHQSLERRVQARTQELQKAVEARDEFLSIASHELRTPITTLRLQQQILERQIAKNPGPTMETAKVKELVEMASRQVSQLSRLVDDMLDVSRVATGRLRLRLERTNISELVEKAFTSFSAQFNSAGVQATLKTESELWTMCDPQRIEQVISNLLSNAIKYGQRSPIIVQAGLSKDYLEVRVTDQGLGISAIDQARIFKRFERAVSANEVSGLGLGLYISQQIIESHGGVISVDSELGKGAKFTIKLPIFS